MQGSVSDEGERRMGNLLLNSFECPENAGDIVNFLMRSDANEIRLHREAFPVECLIQFNDVGDDGIRNPVFVKHIPQKARKNDIGVRSHQIMLDKPLMLGEERRSSPSMIGKDYPLSGEFCDSNPEYGR